MGAAHWPGSRAHAPQLWPGWSFLQAEMQPLQSWTLQMARLTEGGDGGEGRPDSSPFLLSCFRGSCASFFHP